MARITDARNSSDTDATAGVPDTGTAVEKTLVAEETVDIAEDEDTAGSELSRLFLVRQGAMACNNECSEPKIHKKVIRSKNSPKRWPLNNPANKMWKPGREQAKEQQRNSKQTTRANLRGDGQRNISQLTMIKE